MPVLHMPVACARPTTLFLVVWLTGCAAPLPYQPAPLDLPAARAAFAARDLDDAALQAFMRSAGATPPAADASWTRQTLALAAAWFSPALAVAQARWAAALAQRTQSLQPAGAVLAAGLDHNDLVDGGRTSPWALGLGFEFTLPSPARRSARTLMADAEVEQARLALAEVAWQVQQAVAQAWVDAQVAQARHALWLRRWHLQQAMQAATQQQVAQGVRSPAELTNAVRQAEEVRLLEMQASAELAARMQALRSAAALPAGKGAERSIALPPLPDNFDAPASAMAQQLALDNRLDLQLARAQFLRADGALQLAVAQQYPELTLHPGYEWDQGDHRLRIGIALPVRLPDAHPAAIALAEAERSAQAQAALAVQASVLQDVDRALAALDRAEQQRAQQAALQQTRVRGLQDAQTAVRLGAADQNDQRLAEIEVVQGQLQALDLQAASAQALLQLQAALHLPVDPKQTQRSSPE